MITDHMMLLLMVFMMVMVMLVLMLMLTMMVMVLTMMTVHESLRRTNILRGRPDARAAAVR